MAFHKSNYVDSFSRIDGVDENNNDTSITLEELTPDEKAILGSWISLIATLKQSDEQGLQDIINSAINSTSDISNLNLLETTKLFVQALDVTEKSDGNIDAIIEQVTLQPLFPQTQSEYLQEYSLIQSSNQPDLRSCNCSTYLTDSTLSDSQYVECMGQCLGYDPNAGYCLDTSASNYGAFASCEYNDGTSFGDTTVGGIFNDLWDATLQNSGIILEALFGGGNDDNNPNDPSNPDSGDDDDDDDNSTQIDWGKIAIWGGVVVALGLGTYFVFRKK